MDCLCHVLLGHGIIRVNFVWIICVDDLCGLFVWIIDSMDESCKDPFVL